MTIQEFNARSLQEQKEELFRCCGSAVWVEQMIRHVPLESLESFLEKSDHAWFALSENEWLEAFSHHPKIGDVKSLQKKFAATAGWASGEQAGVSTAGEQTLSALKKGNDDYEDKFGFIFIVCATGKSAEEMLQLLLNRLQNNYEMEIRVAAEEQNKITHLRLHKLFS